MIAVTHTHTHTHTYTHITSFDEVIAVKDMHDDTEEATLGVFRLGRVKSGETLGNGCSSTKSLLGSWETWVVSKNLD